MVRYAIKEDQTINPRTFGDKAVPYIVNARQHHRLGNYELEQIETERAIRVEQSSSCPGAASSEEENIDRFSNTVGDLNIHPNEEWHGGKVYKNIKCRSCDKVKPVVGACHICRDCVGKPSKIKRTEEKLDRRRKVLLHTA